MKNETYKMSVRIITFLLTFFLIIGNSRFTVVGQAEEIGNLYAMSAVLMDGDTGRILYGKDENIARANASTTKILTCILALENSTRDDVVMVSEHASRQPKVHAGLAENELYFMEDLLHSLMLESHNDSAVAIAEHIAGSVEAFAELMNKKALEIGCKTANFVTPNGLDGSNKDGRHGISASDLALIMRYCIKESPQAESFIKITQTRQYTFQEITGKQVISCVNRNAFLDMEEGVISGKTGFTGEAGYCYVTAVKQDGKTFIIALLGCGWPNNKTYKWKDAKKLLKYGRETYKLVSLKQPKKLPSIMMEHGVPTGQKLCEHAYAELETTRDSINVLLGQNEQITMKIECNESMEAPIQAGTVVGHVTYYIEDVPIHQEDLVVKHEVQRKNMRWIFSKLWENYLHLVLY